MTTKIDQNTSDFLEALLFGFCWDCSELEESEYGIYDFPEDFVGLVSDFVNGFEADLLERGIVIPETGRSFGGNCYWSLSGHGVGFWDDSETDHLQSELIKWANGDKYKFEQIELFDNGYGLQVECHNL